MSNKIVFYRFSSIISNSFNCDWKCRFTQFSFECILNIAYDMLNIFLLLSRKPAYKPDSNIHQLRNNKPDDDENNTYNGNSTQQL